MEITPVKMLDLPQIMAIEKSGFQKQRLAARLLIANALRN